MVIAQLYQKKQWIFLLFFLSFIPLVVLAQQKLILDIPSSMVINGKNISVIGIQGNAVNIDVDGVVELVADNTTKLVNGVTIYIYGLSRSPPRVILDITVNVVCGDGICGGGEDFVVCCTDCGCLTSQKLCMSNRCVENITYSGAKNECFAAVDCDDQNQCTRDACDTSAYPNICRHTSVTVCLSGDNCCPGSCEAPEDQDCAVLDKCTIDIDCADGNPCTNEACSGTPKRCLPNAMIGCPFKEQCVSEGTILEGKYCLAASNEWILQQKITSSCTKDYECLSLICALGKCREKRPTFLFMLFSVIAIVLVIGIILYLRTAYLHQQQKKES